MSNLTVSPSGILSDSTGAAVGVIGTDKKEYVFPVAAVLSTGAANKYDFSNYLYVRMAGAGAGTTLSDPLIRGVNSVNGFTQYGIQNLSAGTSSSSDHITYPDNNTNDLTGFADMGMTSSGFADAAYTVTGQNEAYLFGSAPSGASKSGSLVLATDSTGTNNNIDFYVGGFNKAKTAYSARIVGSNGMLQVREGLSLLGKTIINNGATTTYTVAAKTNYVYMTTSAASMAFTLPAAAAAIDGLMITVVTNIAVATVTWASTGATFAGAPAASLANTPIRLIYDHATLIWYIR